MLRARCRALPSSTHPGPGVGRCRSRAEVLGPPGPPERRTVSVARAVVGVFSRAGWGAAPGTGARRRDAGPKNRDASQPPERIASGSSPGAESRGWTQCPAVVAREAARRFGWDAPTRATAGRRGGGRLRANRRADGPARASQKSVRHRTMGRTRVRKRAATGLRDTREVRSPTRPTLCAALPLPRRPAAHLARTRGDGPRRGPGR